MKNNFFLLFLLLLNIQVFAQDKVAKVTFERWDEAENKWQFNAEDTWDYNQNDQEIMFTHKDINLGAYSPVDQISRVSYYDNRGNLVRQEKRTSGLGWTEQLTTHQYNDQQILTESLEEHTFSESSEVGYNKYVYERNESELSRSASFYYSRNSPDEWFLAYKRDSFFNENGCLIKNRVVNYHENNASIDSHEFIMTYDQNCRMISNEYWRKGNPQDSFFLFAIYDYEYSDDGKISTDTYRRFLSGSNIWETKYISVTEVDDEGRIVRLFHENFNSTYTDTILQLYTFTPKGELSIYKEYKTRHLLNDNPLYLAELDSFIYHYNEEGWLIRKEQFKGYYDNPLVYSTFDYDYYCHGQVKRSIYTHGSFIARTSYEYHSDLGCPLEPGESPQISIYPNPSNGSFTVLSNMLETPNATIRLSTILGREVYFKQLNRLADQYQMDFANLPNGRYVVTLTSGREVQSELLVINN